MKAILPYLLSLALLAGCAAHDRENDRQNKLWNQNEQRLKLLESNITALNEQVSLLNNRVYEVRSANGRKTGMSVVPVVPVAKTQPQPGPKPTAQLTPVPSQPQGLQAHPKTQAPAKTQNQPKASAKQEVKPAPRPAAQNRPPVADNAALALPPTDNKPQASNESPALPPTLPLEGTFSLPPSQAPEPQAQPLLPPDTAGQPAPQAAAKPAPAAKAQAGEEASYQQALKAARSGRSQEGIQKFREFLTSYPNGKYAPNAEFWIGECLYDQGKYQEAINQYATVSSKYPRHHKNADALLKSGMSYKRLGDSAKAKDSYGRLLKEFPNSEAARRARGAR
ncbi:MAG: tol-pal system protein YbgF [Desulfovibrio sp.]|nr:tol-pal system protein YbgF [Desulfovibrio sp.]